MDPPSSKVYSGIPIYRTILGNQIGSNDGFEKSGVELHCVARKES